MARGRKPLQIPNVRWVHYVPFDLAAKVELILADPIRGKAKFGERSDLMTTLLRDWLKKLEGEPSNETPPPTSADAD